jgi:hypothetical protein
MLFLAGLVSADNACPEPFTSTGAIPPLVPSSNPIISDINRSSGIEGDTVTITGKNFGDHSYEELGESYVTFGNFLDSDIICWTDSKIIAKVPNKNDALSMASTVDFLSLFSSWANPLIDVIGQKEGSINSQINGGETVNVSVTTPINNKSNSVLFAYIESDNTLPSALKIILNDLIQEAKGTLSFLWDSASGLLSGDQQKVEGSALKFTQTTVRSLFNLGQLAQTLVSSTATFLKNVTSSQNNLETQQTTIPQPSKEVSPTQAPTLIVTPAPSPTLTPPQTSSPSIAIIPINSIAITGNRKGVYDTVPTRQTLLMIADVLPKDATNQNVTWSVISGTGTATIDQSGMLTGTSAGIITVLAKATDGSGIVGTKQITVTATIQYPSSTQTLQLPQEQSNSQQQTNTINKTAEQETQNFLGNRLVKITVGGLEDFVTAQVQVGKLDSQFAIDKETSNANSCRLFKLSPGTAILWGSYLGDKEPLQGGVISKWGVTFNNPVDFLVGVICLTEEEWSQTRQLAQQLGGPIADLSRELARQLGQEGTLGQKETAPNSDLNNLDLNNIINVVALIQNLGMGTNSQGAISFYEFRSLLKKFPNADSVEILATNSVPKIPNVEIQDFKLCNSTIKRGEPIKFSGKLTNVGATSIIIQTHLSSFLVLSTDETLDYGDTILQGTGAPTGSGVMLGYSDPQTLEPGHSFEAKCDDYIFWDVRLPLNIAPGKYFIGILYNDGTQVNAPLIVE